MAYLNNSVDQLNRAFAPVNPTDQNDSPLFSQLSETVKDAFILELREFFYNASLTSNQRIELPTIEKYADFSNSLDPFITNVNVISRMPDKPEAFPHVAVMTASSAERKMTIGPPFVSVVQDPPQIQVVNAEPYALADGNCLSIITTPKTIGGLKPSTPTFTENIYFTADRFPTAHPVTSALAVDVARVINEQAQYCRASVVAVSNLNYVVIAAGEPKGAKVGFTPTSITIGPQSVHADSVLGVGAHGIASTIGGAQPNMTLTAPAGTFNSAMVTRSVVVTGGSNPYFNGGTFPITGFSTVGGVDTLTYTNKFGIPENPTTATFYVGFTDNYLNPLRPPKNRYVQAANFTVSIDIFAEDPNTRTELVDLVTSFLGFFMESQYFTMFGRSGFSVPPSNTTDVTNEFYEINLQTGMNIGAEVEADRPGDTSGKMYCQSITIPCTITMYLDRQVFWPGTTTPAILTPSNLVLDTTLPILGENSSF